MDSLLLARDKRLQLEMEASHPLHHMVSNLVRLFPDAKFILTIRNPYAWLSSEINQGVRNFVLEDRVYRLWATLRDYRYSRYQFEFQKPEQSFASIDSVYPIASLLSYWRDHNQSVIDTVPSKQLLILRTTEIKAKIPDIAKFLGIDPETIDRSKSQSGAASENPLDLRETFPNDFLQEQMQLHCGNLVKTFFPELLA